MRRQRQSKRRSWQAHRFKLAIEITERTLKVVDAILTVHDLAKMLNIVPVEGQPNVCVIRSSPLEVLTDKEMTEEDWDKFERDIYDAFEQIP